MYTYMYRQGRGMKETLNEEGDVSPEEQLSKP